MPELKTHIGGLLHPMVSLNQPSPPRRRRARSMSSDERREQIIDVAMPMVAERGTQLKTADIAKAAGIAEGTIFRVFADCWMLV